jgi:hypothetical protein
MHRSGPARLMVALPLLLPLLLVACGLGPAGGGSKPATSANASRQCMYTYGSGGNSELAAQVKAALITEGLAPTDATVREVGENENCSDGSSRLLVQSREYSATLPAADLSDRQAISAPLGQAMRVLGGFATKQGDRTSVTFVAGATRLICPTAVVEQCTTPTGA